jgi:alkanesulfonate monooxygenase SsuD/methylene tetrahydromethanopterin reductase-like flavin-dependent oxidoreductase (luciferase family)
MRVSVGTFLPPFDARSAAQRRVAVTGLDAAGVDHLAVGDHVSFLGGLGFDGLVQASHLLALNDRLPVHVGVYLLALRHPVPVARQLADLAALAPGRILLGVGVGGEDRHEFSICGVDPATRGRRTDESLALVRRLLSGDPVTSDGPFFPVDRAQILPAAPDIPIVVGGRSEAALRRAAEHGDGWLGIWVSPRRFAEATEHIAQRAVEAGRAGVDWRHGLQVWCGFGRTVEEATTPLAKAMEGMYSIPFASFARYCPAGTAEDVATFLQPYVDAGCRSFNLIPRADDHEHALAGVAEVARLLHA